MQNKLEQNRSMDIKRVKQFCSEKYEEMQVPGGREEGGGEGKRKKRWTYALSSYFKAPKELKRK